jgi:hypothetical protein
MPRRTPPGPLEEPLADRVLDDLDLGAERDLGILLSDE